jgi:hypothetical protein
VVNKIQFLQKEIGMQELHCFMNIGGLEHEKVVRSMDLFAKHVMPHVRDGG